MMPSNPRPAPQHERSAGHDVVQVPPPAPRSTSDSSTGAAGQLAPQALLAALEILSQPGLQRGA